MPTTKFLIALPVDGGEAFFSGHGEFNANGFFIPQCVKATAAHEGDAIAALDAAWKGHSEQAAQQIIAAIEAFGPPECPIGSILEYHPAGAA